MLNDTRSQYDVARGIIVGMCSLKAVWFIVIASTQGVVRGYYFCVSKFQNICVMCINQLSFCVKEAEGGISAKQN